LFEYNAAIVSQCTLYSIDDKNVRRRINGDFKIEVCVPMKKMILALMLIAVAVLPAVAQMATGVSAAENEALRKALEQALRENIELRAELEAARAEIDRLRGGAVRPIGMMPLAAPQSAVRTHVVKEGETLGVIAARYYGAVAAFQKIADANRGTITDPNLIFPGQTLTIP
jgi:nucleoid-associated protein YgaU